MGAAIWIELFGRPLKETADDCCKMYRLSDQLDEIAGRVAVLKLSGFFDYSELEIAADAEARFLVAVRDGHADEAEDLVCFHDVSSEPVHIRQAVGEWFDPSQGLRTIQALIHHVTAHPETLKLPTHSAEDFSRYHRELLSELRLCECFLIEAAQSGQQFRLLIVP